MIGKRVVIEYSDENEAFATMLPRRGSIIRRFTSLNGVDDWFEVKLDEPFDYQVGS